MKKISTLILFYLFINFINAQELKINNEIYLINKEQSTFYFQKLNRLKLNFKKVVSKKIEELFIVAKCNIPSKTSFFKLNGKKIEKPFVKVDDFESDLILKRRSGQCIDRYIIEFSTKEKSFVIFLNKNNR